MNDCGPLNLVQITEEGDGFLFTAYTAPGQSSRSKQAKDKSTAGAGQS